MSETKVVGHATIYCPECGTRFMGKVKRNGNRVYHTGSCPCCSTMVDDMSWEETDGSGPEEEIAP